jgi:hypothetical protein
MLELREEVVYMQETEDKCCTELQNEMCSIKTIKLEDKRCALLAMRCFQ